MKKQKYFLTVDNPCSQNWDSMTQNNAGRFCTNCSKTVIDFEHMTDAEILKVIAKQSNELCGRFNTSQLNREIISPESKAPSRFQKILAGFLLIAGSGISPAKAQQPSIKVDTSIHTTDSLTIVQAVTGKMSYPTSVIWGIVMDSASKAPILAATISIKNCKSNIKTDAKGEFKFKIPDSMLGDSIQLTISSVEYEDKDFFIDKKELGKKLAFPIVLNPKTVTLGAVVIVKDY